jgi:hypothetical protein
LIAMSTKKRRGPGGGSDDEGSEDEGSELNRVRKLRVKLMRAWLLNNQIPDDAGADVDNPAVPDSKKLTLGDVRHVPPGIAPLSAVQTANVAAFTLNRSSRPEPQSYNLL